MPQICSPWSERVFLGCLSPSCLALGESRLIQIKCYHITGQQQAFIRTLRNLFITAALSPETCSSVFTVKLILLETSTRTSSPLRSECGLTSDSGFLSSMQSEAVLEERSARSTSPSLLTATVGQRVLSRLDEGSGCTSPEQVIALWTEEGIRNSRDILQVSTDQDQVWGQRGCFILMRFVFLLFVSQ